MIAERPTLPELDVEAVFAEQRRLSRSESHPSIEARRASLDKLEKAIRANHDALVAALAADFRKSPDETEITEFVGTLEELRFARSQLAAWTRPEMVDAPLSLFGSKAEIRYEPKGVALILAPWNYPFYLSIAPLVAALAAGNRAIVRPSEKAPATRAVIAAMISKTFRANEVAVAQGEVEMAERLLRLPFDHIFFTGSTHVGKIVMRAAAEHLASVTLELGGKSPAIVSDDADIEHAARRIAWGKFLNGGQTCVAPDYALVHGSVERRFVKALTETVTRMYGKTDAQRKASRDFCRMIDAGHFERVAALLGETLAAGAKLEIGGDTDAAERYIAPTVVSGVAHDAPLMSQEIFGPVLPIVTYTELADALALINARPKPLALYGFTKKQKRMDEILRATSAGGTLFNDVILHLANPNLPFGGVGESGMGSYHGIFGFKAFSHARAVMRQTPLSLAPMLVPPYSKRTRRMVATMEKLP